MTRMEFCRFFFDLVMYNKPTGDAKAGFCPVE